MSTKQVIVVRKDLNMRKGKIAAQVAHASLGIFTEKFRHFDANTYNIDLSENEIDWLENSFTKICVSCDSEQELLELYVDAQLAGLPHKLIQDNGATEFHGVPTYTCLAIGPAKAEDIDKVTGGLKLL